MEPNTPVGEVTASGLGPSGSEHLADDMRSDAHAGMKGIARQTVVYGIGIVLGKSLSVIMLPVYTRFLTPADYGVMELIMMTLDVVMIIAGSRLLEGIYRFYHKSNTPEERNQVVSTAFLLLMGSFALLGSMTALAAPALSHLIFGRESHANLIRIAAVTTALTPALMVPLAYFRMRNRAGIVVSADLLKLLGAAGLNVYLLLRGWGVMAIFVSALTATTIVGLSVSRKMIREVGLTFSPRVSRDLFRYGLPLVATNFATFAYTFGDRFFLQHWSGEAAVGLYMMAYQFGFLLMLVGNTPFMNVWAPRRFEIANRPDRDALYARGFVYLNLLMLPVAAGMVLFIGDFFRVMTTPPFYAAAQYVPVIVVAYVLFGWGSTHDIGLLVAERTTLVSYANWIAAGVAILGYVTLVPKYSAWGAAWATLATFAVRYALILRWSQRVWPVRYQWTPVLRLAGFSAATGAVGWALPTMPLAVSLAVRTAIFGGYLVTIWFGGVLDDEAKEAVRKRMGWAFRAGRGLLRARRGQVGS